ncbi:hypothetical protein [Hallella colorans]|uniref:Uncharacterized protein n=1 Tax=Hallella colorans TaxID=1703337 RepID=A0A2U0UK40_9BACT|nr:hypothetical protein [Hallella colorans]PVX57992.1 hypothetical protein C7379_103115 [Hallella colorans]
MNGLTRRRLAFGPLVALAHAHKENGAPVMANENRLDGAAAIGAGMKFKLKKT